MEIQIIKSNPQNHHLRIGKLSERLDFLIGNEPLMVYCFKDDSLLYKFCGQQNITNIPIKVENEITKIVFKTINGIEQGIYTLKQ